jgi:choline dehydrogenase-like flavoprotein
VFVQPTGELGVIEAEKFIVCCGGIESPKLLLASSNRYWEYGVGNDLGYVGKFFTEHPGITCTGLLESFIRSPETESLYNTACSRHFDSYEHQSTGKFLIEVIDVRDYDLAARIEEGMSFEEIEKDIASGLPLALGALIESIPRKENSVQLGKGKNRFFIPNTSIDFSLDTTTMESMKHAHAVLSQILTKIGCHHVSSTLSLWWARHHMGTCRMAKDPSAGVVDENLRVHDTENVYVCSSAVFPTCGSANPTLTIAALAHRLGRHLVNSDASAHTEMSKLEERTD